MAGPTLNGVTRQQAWKLQVVHVVHVVHVAHNVGTELGNLKAPCARLNLPRTRGSIARVLQPTACVQVANMLTSTTCSAKVTDPGCCTNCQLLKFDDLLFNSASWLHGTAWLRAVVGRANIGIVDAVVSGVASDDGSAQEWNPTRLW